MSHEPKRCLQSLELEDLSASLEIVNGIPDGIRLTNFPGHCAGAECWCRPQVTFSGNAIVVQHKDLNNGDFDC
ncbi:MAG TPA: hypothetical protein VH437_17890 [Terriglobales bacterium]